MKLPAFLHPAPDSVVAHSRARGKSPWMEAIHLVWSAWIFLTPVFSHDGFDLQWSLITLITYPLFLLLYAKNLTASRRSSNYYALALVAMSLISLRWYSGAPTYFIYGCLFFRSCSWSLWRHESYIAGLNLLFAVAVFSITHYSWQVVLWIAMLTLSFSLVIEAEILAGRHSKALRLSQDEVRRLAATAERERIGRDLHDLLGHTLSLITLKLELSGKLFDRDPEKARGELADAEQIARKALAEVRSAVTGIRATDLAAELASAHLMLETIGVVMHYEPPARALPPGIESVLALVVREAATNIARHARATRASIATDIDASRVRLYIRDNGRGGVDKFGNGLEGMRERARALGGSLRVDSQYGQGTTLCIEIPLPATLMLRSTHDLDEAHADEPAPPLLGNAS